MGGGEARNESYAARRPGGDEAVRRDVGRSLDEYATKPRVFISFHVEDEHQVDLLRAQAKDPRYGIEFTDYSVKEPFDEKWKTQCTERIKRSSVLVVMIGPETYSREAVLWEINKAYELGKPVIGVRIYRDANHKIPAPLIRNRARVINWDLDNLQSEIDRAMDEGNG